MRKFLRLLFRFGGGVGGGFTLIELLVVIAIVGILAVAVLSTLNPIEQLNRGRDTRSRSDAAELLGAIERYYSANEVYPWNSAAAPATLPTIAFASNITSGTWTSVAAWPTRLVTANEVKTSLDTRLTNDKKHYVLKNVGAASLVYVCFQPSSTSFKTEAAKNCANGTTPASVNAQNLCTAGSEFLCLP